MSERKSNSKTITKRGLTRRRNAARRRAARRKSPMGRLIDDGASSNENTRRRLRWLAHERQIPEKELPKVVTCYPTDELLDFARKHHISLDWLFGGDLNALHRMMGKPRTSTVERIMEKYGQLSPDLQRIWIEQVNRLLAEQSPTPA